MNEKTFTFAGVACKNGIHKVRWANTAERVKALHKDGQTDIRLVALPEAMTKFEAVQIIMDLEMFQDDLAQQAIADYLDTVPANTKRSTQATDSTLSDTDQELMMEFDTLAVDDSLIEMTELEEVI